jgi:hypothetical protein
MTPDSVIDHFQTSSDGLIEEEAAKRLKLTGPNILSSKKSSTVGLLPFNLSA